MNYFFKTSIPTSKIYLSGFNRFVEWDKINPDVGLFMTQRDDVAAEFRKAINRGAAVSEILEREYQELKKNQVPVANWPKPSREELRKPSKLLRDTTMPRQSLKPEPPSLQESENRAAAGVAELRKTMDQSPLPPELKPSPVRRRRMPKDG